MNNRRLGENSSRVETQNKTKETENKSFRLRRSTQNDTKWRGKERKKLRFTLEQEVQV